MKPAPIDLKGAVVAITGGARGIGFATAQAFADEGATVCIGDLDAERAADAAEAINGGAGAPDDRLTHVKAHAFALDVTDRGSFAEFLESATVAAGPIDVLVNNAGIMPAGRFLDESDEVADAILAVNTWGPILGMKLALPGMIGRGRGHVINISSYAGKVRIPGLATYCASKYAVVGLTATVRDELDGTGVTASAVLPSAVNTELASGIDMPFSKVLKVEPSDVARAVVANVGDRAAEVAVPRLLGAYAPANTLIPARVESAVRRLIRHDRAITAVSKEGRALYADRIRRQVGGGGTRASRERT